MNTAELAERVAADQGLDKNQTKTVIEVAPKAVMDTVKSGADVNLAVPCPQRMPRRMRRTAGELACHTCPIKRRHRLIGTMCRHVGDRNSERVASGFLTASPLILDPVNRHRSRSKVAHHRSSARQRPSRVGQTLCSCHTLRPKH